MDGGRWPISRRLGVMTLAACVAVAAAAGRDLAGTAARSASTAAPLVVNTTSDTEDGQCDAAHCSLRDALAAAGLAAGPDSVTFDIPTTDAGYDPATGVWTIRPADTGYTVPADTTVDGMIGAAPSGPAALRPGIEIDGTTLAQPGVTGLWLYDHVTLRGLIINHFQYGVWVARAGVTITGCYVGTDATGADAKPNGADGILLANGATGALVEGNLIAGNAGNGVRLFGAQTSGNTLHANRIGTHRDGAAALANGGDGIRLHLGAHDNTIEGNQISGNSGIGVHLLDAGTDQNRIRDNRIGLAAGDMAALGNASFGVAFFDGPSRNVTGPGNVIAYNALDGVLVDGSDSFTSTVGNTITANRITANGRSGILDFRGGNRELPPPAISAAGASQAAGSACAGCRVELFSDAADEGAVFEGAVTAGASGQWVFGQAGGFSGRFLTATATDGSGNTSAFSAPYDRLAPTATATASATPTARPSATPTATATATATRSPTASATASATPTTGRTATATPTATSTRPPTASATASVTPSRVRPTATRTPRSSPTATAAAVVYRLYLPAAARYYLRPVSNP